MMKLVPIWSHIPIKLTEGERMHFSTTHECLPLLTELVGGITKGSTPAHIPDSFALSTCWLNRAQKYIEEDPHKYIEQPLRTIKKAAEDNKNIGSATFVVLTIDGNQLKYCYIGGTRLLTQTVVSWCSGNTKSISASSSTWSNNIRLTSPIN